MTKYRKRKRLRVINDMRSQKRNKGYTFAIKDTMSWFYGSFTRKYGNIHDDIT